MRLPFEQTAPDMLYIHWPFCASKCTYCDFVALQDHSDYMERYHRALCNQIRLFAEQRPHVKQHPIKTIFFGGGTPSLYPLHLLRELFDLLNLLFDLSACEEVSLEVNPGGQTDEHFQTWKELGISRLSVGVQVLDEDVLAKLRRFQTNKDVCQFFQKAPHYIENLSSDMIIGLPGVTDETWRRSIETALAWSTKHFSLYFLTVHEHTPLYYGVKKKRIALPKDEQVLAQYEWTVNRLAQEGFEQYEISNFARPGYKSRHNVGYWQRNTYMGFGIGAASFDGRVRFSNTKKLSTFIESFATYDADKPEEYASYDVLSGDDVLVELVMLGLRLKEGQKLSALAQYATQKQLEDMRDELKKLSAQGFVEVGEGRFHLTQYGILYENDVAARLCLALDRSQHNNATIR